jgi:hypothetical protein
MRGICLDHIWLKSVVRQSPPMNGTFWTTFGQGLQRDKVPLTRGTIWATYGQKPLRDKALQWGAQFGPHLVEVPCMTKVLQWGAQFGPHLVKVHCMTKFSDEGHSLDHIWSKSTVRQSPPMRGIIFCHIWPLSAARQLCLMVDHGYHSLATFDPKVCCVTRPQINWMCIPFYARLSQSQLIDMQLSLVIFQFFECL